MKYLNLLPAINLGGHPISLNDLTTIQNGIFDVLYGISGMGNDSQGIAILQPIEITESGSTFDNNAFFVILMGSAQLVRVVASTGAAKSSDPGAKYYIRVSNSVGADNPVSYESGQQFNVHFETSATLVHTHLPTGDDYLISLFNNNGWRGTTLLEFGVDISAGTFASRYRVIDGNTMMLYLQIIGQVETGVVKFILPKPYLFKKTFKQVVPGSNGGSSTSLVLQGVADGFELSLKEIDGTDISAGNSIAVEGYVYFEIKYRDS